MRRIILMLAAGLFCLNILQAQPVTSLLAKQEDAGCKQWVDNTLGSMSMNEKVSQLFVYTLAPGADKKTRKQVQQLAKKYGVGALLFSEGSITNQVLLTNLAQQSSKVPVLMTFDGEWGLGTHLSDALHFPKNAALGCIQDNNLIEAYGREVARELKEMGIQVNFAPDADVSTNPKNPVIHVRSFGENPKAVADKVVAYCRGLEGGGVLSVVKHFPGHGDTSADSHWILPRLYGNRARLDSVELYPFRQAIAAGAGGVMVGHLRVPALDPEEVSASSLSSNIVTGLLKNEMGFKGLVFSDALAMRSVSSEPDVTVKALKAGNDMVLIQQDIDQAQSSVLAAMAAGTLSAAEVTAKCRKVLTYKYLLGLNQRPVISAKGLAERLRSSEAQALATRLRIAAVTVSGNDFGFLPLAAEGSVAILSIGDADTDRAFITRFSKYASAESFRVTKATTGDQRKQILEKLRTFRRVVISVTATDDEISAYRPFFASLNLPMPAVYTFFTSYRALLPLESQLKLSSAVVLAHSAEEDVQQHVADVLFAKASASGKLSVSIGSLFAAGEGKMITPGMAGGNLQPEECGLSGYVLHRIDSVVNEGLAAGAFPGCQVLVMKNGKPVYNRCFGVHSDKDATPVRPTDLFDLDALSKTTGTLLAVMKLIDEGKLKLTDKAAAYLPWLKSSDKKNITLRDLLLHESGLLPYIRFYRDIIDEKSVTGPFAQGFVDEWHHTRIDERTYACSDFRFKKGLTSAVKSATHTLQMADNLWLAKNFKTTMQQSIARSELGEKRFVYSDLGFILLQQVVEAVTKQSMDDYLTQTFYTPMGLTHTLYLPLSRFSKSEIMPTATNDYLRRQDLCGTVLDETAACMGGVSGNAGLFSTATEVGQLYQMLLNGGELNGKRYLSKATCQLFVTENSAFSHRGLGFDKPNRIDSKASDCSANAPAAVVGHTGITGTCAWADPENGLIYVFLSNRVCPNAWNGKLNQMKIKQALQKLAYESKLTIE